MVFWVNMIVWSGMTAWMMMAFAPRFCIAAFMKSSQLTFRMMLKTIREFLKICLLLMAGWRLYYKFFVSGNTAFFPVAAAIIFG